MKIYYKYFSRYKIPFLIAIGCVAFESICDLLGPTIMANIINIGIKNKSLESVLKYGSIMLLITLIGACFAITRNILAGRVSQRMGADLRYDLFGKIMRFSEESTDKIASGSLITRMTNDTSQITQFVNGMMRIFMKAPITCIGSIILATMLNYRLALIVYGVVVAVGLLIYLSMKLSYPRFSKLQKAMDRMNSVVQEYLIGVRLVKAFGTYDQETERFGDFNFDLMKCGVSSNMIITLLSPIMTFSIGLGTIISLFFGSVLFTHKMVQPGDISAFTIYLAQILSSLMMITNIFNVFVRTKASTTRIAEVLDCDEDFSHSGEIQKLNGDISFENVCFAYPGGSGLDVIKDLSFSVSHGQSLAIIGPTGSGKSTICWLLLRFYDTRSGTILLGGNDIKDINVDTLRRNIAIVPQKPMLFSGSVAYNLRWGDKNATPEMMQDAVKKAEAGFIEKMDLQYDSFLGSGGVNLSGGQKQRVSIARGLLKNASVLILDDATSALDAVTEAKVRKQLIAEKNKHTVITVTQRCTTAMYADRILVMDNGRCVGFGSHRELMECCDIYRDIFKSQVESSKEAM